MSEELTPEEFLKTKKLHLSKDMYAGYNIPYAYLKTLLTEYNELKTIELRKNMEQYPKLLELAEEVVKVWNEDGDCGEIQRVTPIAWTRVIRRANTILNVNESE